MSFQAYLDTIKKQTGMDPADFHAAAAKKGIVYPDATATQITTWLKDEYGLGYGHAGAIYKTMKDAASPKMSADDKVAKHFKGPKAKWRSSYDKLHGKLDSFEDGIVEAPVDAYISLTRKGKKVAIVAVTKDRLDVGIKLKGVEPTGRYAAAGKWNAMMTHRVQITDPKEVNADLFKWLKRAYDGAV